MLADYEHVTFQFQSVRLKVTKVENGILFLFMFQFQSVRLKVHQLHRIC